MIDLQNRKNKIKAHHTGIVWCAFLVYGFYRNGRKLKNDL